MSKGTILGMDFPEDFKLDYLINLVQQAALKQEQEDETKSTIELERKWLVRPDILNPLIRLGQLSANKVIERIYVSTNPEVRLSGSYKYGGDPKDTSWKVAVKSQGGAKRKEYEVGILASSVDSLLPYFNKHIPRAVGNPIIKHFWSFKFSGHKFEINEVDSGVFWYMEVEFATEDEMNSFEVPEELQNFVLTEVTGEIFWKMGTYWEATRVNSLPFEAYECRYKEAEHLANSGQSSQIGIASNLRRDLDFINFINSRVFKLALLVGYLSKNPTSKVTTAEEVIHEFPVTYPPTPEMNCLPKLEAEAAYGQYVHETHDNLTKEGIKLLQICMAICLETLDIHLGSADIAQILRQFKPNKEK